MGTKILVILRMSSIEPGRGRISHAEDCSVARYFDAESNLLRSPEPGRQYRARRAYRQYLRAALQFSEDNHPPTAPDMTVERKGT